MAKGREEVRRMQQLKREWCKQREQRRRSNETGTKRVL